MMKVAASLLIVLTSCTEKSKAVPDAFAKKAKIVERMCGLPSGSLKFVDNEVRINANPPPAYNKVGCIITEMQERGLVGRVGLISEPPTGSEVN